jgi:hypothetical protein
MGNSAYLMHFLFFLLKEENLQGELYWERLLCAFFFGRRDTQMPHRDFSFGWGNIYLIAAPQFFFWSAQSFDCRAVIFLLTRAIF